MSNAPFRSHQARIPDLVPISIMASKAVCPINVAKANDREAALECVFRLKWDFRFDLPDGQLYTPKALPIEANSFRRSPRRPSA